MIDFSQMDIASPGLPDLDPQDLQAKVVISGYESEGPRNKFDSRINRVKMNSVRSCVSPKPSMMFDLDDGETSVIVSTEMEIFDYGQPAKTNNKVKFISLVSEE